MGGGIKLVFIPKTQFSTTVLTTETHGIGCLCLPSNQLKLPSNRFDENADFGTFFNTFT